MIRRRVRWVARGAFAPGAGDIELDMLVSSGKGELAFRIPSPARWFHPKSLPAPWLGQRVMLLAPALDDTARSADRAGQRSRFQSRGKDFPEIDEAGHEGLPEGIAVLDDVADLNLSDYLRAPSSRHRR